jgi:hypothetical protein
MFEVTIRVKGDDQTLNKKFLVYEKEVKVDHDDEYLKDIVESTLKDFKGDVDSVRVKISMEW